MREDDSANYRINRTIEKIAFAAVAIGVSVSASFQWEQYKANSEIRELLKQHDARITKIESDVSWVRGNMLDLGTLKRIELYMASMSPEEAESKLLKAFKAESAAREWASKQK